MYAGIALNFSIAVPKPCQSQWFHHTVSHGLKTSTPSPTKSFTLRVATARPCSSGRGNQSVNHRCLDASLLRSGREGGQRSPFALVTGRTLASSNDSSNSVSSHCSN